MRRMKLNENSRIEEQGNRLVESKAKSPALSPKKFNDTRLANIPKFNLAEGLNTYSNNTYGSSSPVKKNKISNARHF